MQYNANYDLMHRTGQLDFKQGKDGMTPFMKPYDPAGNSVRKLLTRDTSLDPMVNNLPNKAYGDAYGLEWDGRQWVKANPNADLERQAMELELEQRRQDMEKSKYGDNTGLREWLAKKLGGAG
jgi:hypothetical protein